MNVLITVAAASWAAGVAAFLGGLCAFMEGTEETEKKQAFVHGVIAFGGGILTAAIAFALLPPGMALLRPATMALTFSAGGVVFCLLDIGLSRSGGSRSQYMAMLMDFVPEAIALGAVFGHDPGTGFLLALFIGAQNLPEGFNSFREMISSGARPRNVLGGLLGVSLLGPVSAWIGYIFLQEHGGLTAGLMSFAAGGILYLIFQDIAPASRMVKRWVPALGAVLGFLFGMIGKQLLG